MVCISEVAKRTERRMKEEHGKTIEAYTDEFADDATGILGADCEADLQLAINIMLEEFLEYYSVSVSFMPRLTSKLHSRLLLLRQSSESFSRPSTFQNVQFLTAETLLREFSCCWFLMNCNIV